MKKDPHKARPDAPRWFERVRNPWGVAAGTAIIAILFGILNQSRNAELERLAENVHEVHRARIDLAQGFLHAMLDRDEGEPFELNRGRVLMDQAVATVRRSLSAEGFEDIDGSAFFSEASKMSELVKGRGFVAPKNPKDAVLLRSTYHSMENEVGRLDAAMQGRLDRLAAFNNREYVAEIAAAGLVLLLFCFLAFRAEKARGSAERARERAEEDLRRTSENFRQIAESLPQLVWTCAAEGACDFLSRQWLDYTGGPLEAQLGSGWVEWVHPDDRAALGEAWTQAVKNGRGFRHECRIRNRYGDYRWFDTRALPLLDETGAVVKWFGSNTDIDDQREMQGALRQWADAFENCAHGIAVGNPKTDRIVVCNRALALLHHRTIGEMSGFPILDLYYPGERARVAKCLEEADRTGRVRYEALMQRGDGTQFIAQMDVVTVRDGEGRLLRRVATAQDITERRRAEQELRQSEARLRLFVEHAPASLAMFDRGMRYITVSKRWIDDYSLGDRDLRGLCHYDVFPEIGEEWRNIHRRALAGEILRAENDRFVRADGRVQWLRWEVRPWLDADGVIGGLVVFSEDITSSVMALDALRRSEERFETVVRHLREGLVIAGMDGKLLHWNPAAVKMHGFDEAEDWRSGLPDFKKIFELRTPDGRLVPHEEWPLARILRGESLQGLELQIAKTGEDWSRTFTYGGSLIDREGGAGLAYLSISDVTERVRAEKALRDSEERFQFAMHGANDGLWDWNLATGIVYFSPRWKSMLGYEDDEVPNTIAAWHELVHPEDQELVRSVLAQVRPGGRRRLEMEIRMRHKDGHYVHVLSRGFLAKDDGEKALRLVGTHSDISERKKAEAEVRRLNAELEQRVQERTAELTAANKEIESFSYSVSHDLRAPLRGIDGFMRIIAENYSDRLDDAGKGYLGRVLAAAERMSHLIDDMLQLSRISRSSLGRQRTDLSALAKLVLEELRQREPARAVEVAIEPGLVANCDPTLMRILLENLLGNAWKFTSKRTDAKIEIGALPKKPGYFGAYVMDNGAGFDMAYAGKLFGAFQRLHHASEFPGTGVGLATVQRVMSRHGGRAWAEGALEKGATIYFEFPE